MAEITLIRGADVEHLLSRFEVAMDEGGTSTHHAFDVSAIAAFFPAFQRRIQGL